MRNRWFKKQGYVIVKDDGFLTEKSFESNIFVDPEFDPNPLYAKTFYQREDATTFCTDREIEGAEVKTFQLDLIIG